MVNRRDFLKQMALASAGLALGSTEILRATPVAAAATPTKEKVKIAYIGIGNRGEQIIEEFRRICEMYYNRT